MAVELGHRERRDCEEFRSQMENAMKSSQMALCALALSTIVGIAPAFAESLSDGVNAAPGKTRADVKAEIAQARIAGYFGAGELMLTNEASGGVALGAQGAAGSRYSGKTRKEVKAELAQAMSEGFNVMPGEFSYPDAPIQSKNNLPVSTRTRQEVKQEVVEFYKYHPEARINY